MTTKFFKNILPATSIELETLTEYAAGQVVSRTLVQTANTSVTVFSFDKDEAISAHSAPGDAWVYIIDGAASISVGDTTTTVEKGRSILMPAGIPHSLYAVERFKMLLLVVQG